MLYEYDRKLKCFTLKHVLFSRLSNFRLKTSAHYLKDTRRSTALDSLVALYAI